MFQFDVKKHFTGRFYFKQTPSLNLLGEFSNSLSEENYVESSYKLSILKGFDGIYETVWIDKSTKFPYKLIIVSKDSDNSTIYHLVWTNNNNDIVFTGHGMLIDNMLIGDYNNFMHEAKKDYNYHDEAINALSLKYLEHKFN